MAYASTVSAPALPMPPLREALGLLGGLVQVAGFAGVMWLLLAGPGFL